MRHLTTPEILQPAITGLVVTAVALVLRAVLLRRLQRAADGVRGVLRAWDARLPSLLWCFVMGAWAGLEAATLPPRLMARLETLVEALVIITTTITAAGLLAIAAERAARRNGLTVGMTGLAQSVLRISVVVVGAMVALGHLGVSITPMITALGVGGLAAALALQDTVANVFAGFHLLVDAPVRVGDLVKLEAGAEGAVTDIGWRSTRVRTLDNHLVVVPNAKLVQSVITNYSLPTSQTSVGIKVRVTYRSDPERVRRILEEEARRAVGQISGLLGEPAPSARLIPGFEDNALVFTLDCPIGSFTDQWTVQDGLRRRILRRFRDEQGIEIPGMPRNGHEAATPKAAA